MKIRLVLLAAFVALVACVSPNAGAGAPGRGATNVITQQELDALGGNGDALSAIRSLRPGWLRGTRQSTLSDPRTPSEGLIVYLETVRLGGVNSLESLPISNISRLEFLTDAQAQFRFGAGHLQGAIVVIPRGAQ
jgi:hypothetical protein